MHFYASFSLLLLFPEVELSIQRDYGRICQLEDPEVRLMLGEGKFIVRVRVRVMPFYNDCYVVGEYKVRKVRGAVPHDVGSPTEAPWVKCNVYNFQDVSRWKDLGSKFILQVYRDYVLYGDVSRRHGGHCNGGGRGNGGSSHQKTKTKKADSFLADMYAICKEVMCYYESFIPDSASDPDPSGESNVVNESSETESSSHSRTSNNKASCMIENEGFPDQTYDIWCCSGVSCYTGGLWIAACNAMVAMAAVMDDGSTVMKYQDMSTQASIVYNEKLWNGVYYNYDSSDSKQHSSIMSDMLAGQWYSYVCKLPHILLPEKVCHSDGDTRVTCTVPSTGTTLHEPPLALTRSIHDKVYSCLCTIYNNNVVVFGDGKFKGAVNGMRGLLPMNNGDANNGLMATADPNPISRGVDNSCLQSREVWVGTTYGLASLMIYEYKTLIQQNQSSSLSSSSTTTTTTTTTTINNNNRSHHMSLHNDYSIETFDNSNSHNNVVAIGDRNVRWWPGDWWGQESTAATAATTTGSTTVESSAGPSIPIHSLAHMMEPRTKMDLSRHANPDADAVSDHTLKSLYRMSFNTMRGIHEQGWRTYGYQYATPEAWESSGNYRSLGYSRPLCIWAIQLAMDELYDMEDRAI